jgi:hypothetical protein
MTPFKPSECSRVKIGTKTKLALCNFRPFLGADRANAFRTAGPRVFYRLNVYEMGVPMR